MESPRREYVFEYEFPTPLAVAYSRMRRRGEDTRDVNDPIGVVEAALHYLGTVVACDVAAATRAAPSKFDSFWSHINDDSNGMSAFRRPVSGGSWANLIQRGLTCLREVERDSTLRGLVHWFFAQGHDLLESAIRERNLIHAGSANYSALRTHAMQLLSSLADVHGGTYLLAVESLRVVGGTRTAEVRLFEGTQPTPTKLEVSGEIETSRSYLAVPTHKILLSLDPFFTFRTCVECDERHLFRLQYVDDRGRGRYLAVDSYGHPPHRASVEAVAVEMQDLSQAKGSVRQHSLSQMHLHGSAHSQTDEYFRVGERVGRYEVVRLIGEGGMGHVYVGRDSTTNSLIALKVFPHRLLRDRSLLARFREEIQNARRIVHPRIARVLDYGESPGEHFLVLELASGWLGPSGGRVVDLSQCPKPLGSSATVAIGKQLCEALDYLHSLAIVHRDIKPQNVLLFEDGSVKLTDFGIAQSQASMRLTMTGQFLGTPEYIAPEQAEGSRELDHRADLYSLGVVLYELLSGRVPFSAGTPLATALKHKDPGESPPDLPDEVPSGLRRIIYRMLAKPPEGRFQSARQLWEALDKFERDGDYEADPAKEEPDTIPAPGGLSRLELSGPLPAPREAKSEATSPSQVLRWVVFVPVGLLMIAMAQAVAATALERLPPLFAGGLIFIGTPLFFMTAAVASRIAPDPKVGASVLLTLFVLFEVFALASSGARQSSGIEQLARLWVDVWLVVGGVSAGRRGLGAG